MGAFRKTLVRRSDSQALGLDAGAVPAQIDLFADLDGFDVERCAGRFQDVERGGHDFGADAVAVGDRDRGGGCHRCQTL